MIVERGSEGSGEEQLTPEWERSSGYWYDYLLITGRSGRPLGAGLWW